MADAPWTERNCSISIFSNSRCGFSNYFPSEHNLITISSCNININSHLQSLQLSKTCIPSEGHLIFFRLGIFTLFCDYTICPHHRATLGIRWRRSVACSHSNHKGKTKPDRGVTPIVSRHLLISTGQLVPVGSGICRTCRGGIPNLDSMSFEDNDVHVSFSGRSPKTRNNFYICIR
ncbi:uncharacterized protein LOC134696590 [Mytilus trossulus]|uniref:uncharacterized protein LOC134696590 n=1 Tax=Mytilus trossulus TaxID=6551 RepID=UPI003003EEAE